jgi:hypothetical protein
MFDPNSTVKVSSKSSPLAERPATVVKAKRRSDPAMLGKPVHSRLPLDSYFTIHAAQLVPWLLAAVPIHGKVLEPCAGRGHLSLELRNRGLDVASRDLVAHPNPLVPDIEVRDVMTTESLAGFSWVITNLPFDIQDQILHYLLPIAAADRVGVVTLTRAPWHMAQLRERLVHLHPNFLGIVLFPRRPKWFEDGASSPRFDFCWNVWGPEPRPEDRGPQIFYPNLAADVRRGGRHG